MALRVLGAATAKSELISVNGLALINVGVGGEAYLLQSP